MAGKAIKMSTRAAAVALTGASLVFVWGVGLFVLLARAAHAYVVDGKPFNGDQSPRFVFMFALGLVVASWCAGRMKIQKLRRSRRIVLGQDQFQLLEGHGDETRVVANIPYTNIERVECTSTFLNIFTILEIELSNIHDPHTHLPGMAIEETYRVTDRYEEPVREIVARISQRRTHALRQRAADFVDEACVGSPPGARVLGSGSGQLTDADRACESRSATRGTTTEEEAAKDREQSRRRDPPAKRGRRRAANEEYRFPRWSGSVIGATMGVVFGFQTATAEGPLLGALLGALGGGVLWLVDAAADKTRSPIFFGSILAVLAVTLGLIPVVGLLICIPAFFVNRLVAGWQNSLSRLGLGVSVVLTVVAIIASQVPLK